MLVFVITIPLYFFLNYIEIYNSLSAGASVEWKRDTTMPYPNLTVCFAKYFDARLMEGTVALFFGVYVTLRYLRGSS